MKRHPTAIIVLALFLGLFISSAAHAITLDAPRTIEIDRPVTITATGQLTSNQDVCYLLINFGDGTPAARSPNCSDASVPCRVSTTHVYERPGNFTIRAYTTDCLPGAFVKNPVVKTIRVVDFKIERISLYFGNRQPKITVDQYQRELKAFAEISYTGEGLLEGQWEVDGRLFSKVKKPLLRGQQTITIETPPAPPLPTHAVGSHRIQFVVTQPSIGIQMPQALYFVTAQPAPPKPPIRLIAPVDRQTLFCEPIAFRWEGAEKTYAYLVEFTEEGAEYPSYGAYARKTEYTLPADACRSLFTADKNYRWQVKAYDQNGEVIAESEAFNFFITSTP